MAEWQRQRIRLVLGVFLLLEWGVAWAAADIVIPDLLGLPWAQTAVGAGISTLGGIAEMLGRYLRATYREELFHMRRELLVTTIVSVMIGIGGYLAGLWFYWPPSLIGLLLLLAGYGGTRVVVAGVDALILRIRGGA